MPKPSCSRPPHRLRHSIVYTSAQPYSAGRSSFVDPTEESHGGTELCGELAQPLLVAATTGDRQHAGRGATARNIAAARIAVSKPLRGTSRLMLTISSASTGTPNACARRSALVVARAVGTARCRRPAAPR